MIGEAVSLWRRRALNRLKWEFEKRRLSLDYHLGTFGPGARGSRSQPPPFTIGMVTYIVRYDIFRRIIRKMHEVFPGTRIVVAVNGYYKAGPQEAYLSRIGAFLKAFPNSCMIGHSTPQSLSRLWNEIILASGTEKIFIVNDDIDIAPRFDAAFLASGILDREMAIINSSWSHFLISKRTVERIGWFDERLFGVGGEDWDYEARLAFGGVDLADLPMKGILNFSMYTTDFSFGENVERAAGKYTMSSSVFLRRKWRISHPGDQEARFARIWNDHVRLNEGFETPMFHDPALLRKTNPDGECPGPA